MRSRSLALFAFLSLLVAFAAAGCSKAEAPKQKVPQETLKLPLDAPDAETAAPGAGGAVASGKTLFEQKCGVCHDLARAADRKETRQDWVKIVKEMQGKRAGFISDAEAEMMVEFLTVEHGKK